MQIEKENSDVQSVAVSANEFYNFDLFVDKKISDGVPVNGLHINDVECNVNLCSVQRDLFSLFFKVCLDKKETILRVV